MVNVVLYVALPVAMIIDREATVQSVLADSPAMDAARLDIAVTFALALAYTVALHAVSIVLATWFTLKARAGRRWARIALTCYLVLATAASYLSWLEGPQFSWAVLTTAVLHLVMLALLWLPDSSRRFFAAHPAAGEREERRATAR